MTESDVGNQGQLLAEAAELSRRAADLAAVGDLDGAFALEDQADAIRRTARRMRSRTRAQGRHRADSAPATSTEASGSRGPATTNRELVVAALTEIGSPSSPRAVAEYIAARFDSVLDPRGLAAIRRDEQRSWASARSQRPVYVVPALAGQRFVPLRGKIALSAWPLELRIIGPWSERADHLRAVASVARQVRWLATAQPDRVGHLRALLSGYAATLPVADKGDPDLVEQAADAELEVIAASDDAWRADAAERARAILDERSQLWGAELPAIVGGKAG
jgi:hypothetical protein